MLPATPKTRSAWVRPAIAVAFAPLALLAGRGARGDLSAASIPASPDPASPDDPLVWIDHCPFDARHPHAMRCFSGSRVPRSYAQANQLGPFTPPPDAGAGVDASSDMDSCDGLTRAGSAATPSGHAPSQLLAAYRIPAASTGRGKIVAIVNACAQATIASDLAAYRAEFGLPALPGCGGDGGAVGSAPVPGGAPCFGVVSQRGDGVLPPTDSRWAIEIALDVEMVSAACPDCSILLVEADTPNAWDLAPAVNEAVALGATAVSNSYGATEDPSDPFGTAYSDGPYASAFQHDGVLVTVASGDGAYDNQESPGPTGALGPSFPSTVPSVLAVGGTDLAVVDGGRGFVETTWGYSTSGCSGEFARPAYQGGLDAGGCGMRVAVNLAAVASSVATYVGGKWVGSGAFGTSCGTPFIAALFTRLGLAGEPNAFLYAHPGAFFDVTDGGNDQKSSCSGVLCYAGKGWDGPTGWGTPNGAALFALVNDAAAEEPDASALDAASDAEAGSDAATAEAGAGGDGGAKGDASDAVTPATWVSGGCDCTSAGAAPASLPSVSAALATLFGFVAFGRRRRR